MTRLDVMPPGPLSSEQTDEQERRSRVDPQDQTGTAVPEREGLAEATVVGRAQDGDLASFETLMRRYSPPVLRLAHRMLGDRGDAEDVVQDTFVTVWRQLPSLATPELFRAWVYQIATRRCLNVIRSRARHPGTPTDADRLGTASDAAREGKLEDGPSASVQHAAQLEGLDAVLRTLPDEQRVCWIMRELDGLSYPEIAYATRLPVSTVRGRIARARQNLIKGMDQWR